MKLEDMTRPSDLQKLIEYLKGFSALLNPDSPSAEVDRAELRKHIDLAVETIQSLVDQGPVAIQETNVLRLINENHRLKRELSEALDKIKALKQTTENITDSFDDRLGAAIDHAAGSLPEGYVLKLEIEKEGYACNLIMPNGVADVDRETMIDEIEALVEIAIDNKKRFS